MLLSFQNIWYSLHIQKGLFAVFMLFFPTFRWRENQWNYYISHKYFYLLTNYVIIVQVRLSLKFVRILPLFEGTMLDSKPSFHYLRKSHKVIFQQRFLIVWEGRPGSCNSAYCSHQLLLYFKSFLLMKHSEEQDSISKF